MSTCKDTKLYFVYTYIWGHAVVLLVEALCYKPKSRGFNFRCCDWNFSLTYSFRPHYGLLIESASKNDEYQEYFLGGKGGRCVGLTTLPHSCASYLEIWEPQPPGTLRTYPVLYRDYFMHTHTHVCVYIYTRVCVCVCMCVSFKSQTFTDTNISTFYTQ